MYSDWQSRLKEVFEAASGRSTEDRAGYLDEACIDDEDLRRDVESLLLEWDRLVGEAGGAANAVLEFKPKIAYPYHYRGQGGMSDVEKFRSIVSKNPQVEVRLLKWY
ncbi:MAG: hypothetical protein V3S30_10885 [Thermoanaerobaculia bacterium]